MERFQSQIRLRRATAAVWTARNPVLGVGEPGYETDTGKLKVGDGQTAWSSLSYFAGGGGGASDHGALTGLADDDHTQYLLADGTRALSGNLTVTGTVDGRDVAADGTKLDGIESGATADQTGAEIKAAYEAEADTNAFTDAEKTKLAGVETGATADQTGAEIKALYEAEANTNAFTDAEQTKLAGIESGATADQTGSEILTALLAVDGAGSGLDADTLDGQQAAAFASASHTHVLADVTDAGALAALDTVGAAQVDNKAITLAKVQDIATATILGRTTAGTGGPEALTASQARTVLNVEDGANATPFTVAGTAPVSPSAGDLWYSTADDELYAYDGTRSKWLAVGVMNFDLGYASSQSGTHYIMAAAFRTTATSTGVQRGLVCPYPLTVVGWAWHSVSSISGWIHRLYQYDVSAASQVLKYSLAPVGSYSNFQELDLDQDYDAGDLIGVVNTAGTGAIASQNMTIIARRRAV